MVDPNPSRLNCPIDLEETLRVGSFVNAVRVLRDGSEALLDFLVYSPSENKAAVVSRLRVEPEFLRVLHKRLEESLNHEASSDS